MKNNRYWNMQTFLKTYHENLYGRPLPVRVKPIHELYARLPNCVLRPAKRAAYREARLGYMQVYIGS